MGSMDDEMRIAICEDFDDDTERLLACIRESGIAARCETFTNGEALLAAFRPGLYHLVYLDIYLDGMTGMQLAAAIRQRDESVLLAFTTTSRDHALEASKYRSLLYIEKPVTRDMVNHTLLLAAALRDKLKAEVLTVPTDLRHVDVRHDDLTYVEVYGQRCILHLRGGQTVEASTTLNINDLETMLPKPHFCRTHRAYIVNLDRVKRSNGTDFVMQDGGIAYITRRDYRRVMAQYDKWLFGRAREEEL